MDRSSSSPSLLQRFYDKFSRLPEPEVAAQLRRLNKFSEPELLQITKASSPFKRSPQVGGYSYPAPDQSQQLTLPLQPETPETDSRGQSLDTSESGRSVVRASPLTITTPASNNIRIVQEIRLAPSAAPAQQRPRVAKQQSLRFNDNPLVAVLGRQVSGAPVEGFPDGLPEFTPKGVRITLENMIGTEHFILSNIKM